MDTSILSDSNVVHDFNAATVLLLWPTASCGCTTPLQVALTEWRRLLAPQPSDRAPPVPDLQENGSVLDARAPILRRAHPYFCAPPRQ